MKGFFENLKFTTGSLLGGIGGMVAILFVGGILWHTISSNMTPARIGPIQSSSVYVGNEGYAGLVMIIDADETEVNLVYNPESFVYTTPKSVVVEVNEIHQPSCENAFNKDLSVQNECVLKSLSRNDSVFIWVNFKAILFGLEQPQIDVFVNGNRLGHLPILVDVFNLPTK